MKHQIRNEVRDELHKKFLKRRVITLPKLHWVFLSFIRSKHTIEHIWKSSHRKKEKKIRSIAQEVVLGLEEAKRHSSAETTSWKKKHAPFYQKFVEKKIKSVFPELWNMLRLRYENANCPLWSGNVLPKMWLDQKECFLNTIPREKKNQKIIIC